ncbi:MAG: CAP domain-containing protein [[Clostridium] symbiosum]
MRKSLIYAFTAAAMTAAGAAAPMTAQAAVKHILPGGNGQAIVISGNLNSRCENGSRDPASDNMFPGSQIPGMRRIICFYPSFGGEEALTAVYRWRYHRRRYHQGRTNQPGDAAAQVVNLVNEERAKAGLSPLTADRSVTSAAQRRAREIETNFSHTRPNGSSFSTALSEAGVNYRSSGENIAYGQTSASSVMQGWMNSSGHRANILNGNFTKIGVGHYKSASGVDYWTQLFTN